MKLLENKVAIVTGGTKGIGLAITKLFVKEGAKVIACSRRRNDFDVEGADYHPLDLQSKESIQELVDYVVNKYGKIDILINNAGIMMDRTTLKMSEEEFDNVIDTNLKGTFNITKLVSKYMLDNKYGSIVSLSSFVARDGNIGQANYVASKAAIEGMTKCWAREFARHGENIRVNAVAPGIVLTDIFANTPKEIVDSFSAKTALKRLAEPMEVAEAVLFLASDKASYITATTLYVDGGIRL